MSSLFDQYDVAKHLGNEITISDDFPAIYVSESDEVYCFTGVFLNNEESPQISLHTHPYYMHAKHSTDKKFAANIKGFFRIANGCIFLDNYVDNQYDKNCAYKLTNRFIRFPAAASTYYGVMEYTTIAEDAELTRKVFGLTCCELETVLEGYAKTLGRYNMYIQYPRLTRSVRSSNYCDLTDLWIPEQFPYITFQESGYDFSHVSLWGFYRHVQLLMENTMSSRLGQALLATAVDESTLQALLKIDDYRYHRLAKVTKHTFTGV